MNKIAWSKFYKV